MLLKSKLQKLIILLFWVVGIPTLLLFVSSCSSTHGWTATPSTTLLPSTITPTLTPTITSTSTITLTPPPTNTPTITPTPFGGGSGNIIYTEGATVYSYSFFEKNTTKLADNCVWQFAFSSDGDYLACSEARFDNAGSLSTYGITLIDLKTKKIVKSFFDGENMGPEDRTQWGTLAMLAFSPDDTQIAFVGKIKGTRGVYIVDVQTSAYKLVYEHPNALGILWSPDGSKLILDLPASEALSPGGYYLINADGSNLVNVNPPTSYSIEWGKDNNTVVLFGKGIDLKTLEWNGEVYYGSPSPDGKYHLDGYFLVSSDGSKKIKLPRISQYGWSWSPDSKFLYIWDSQEGTVSSLNVETSQSVVIFKMKRDSKTDENKLFNLIVRLPDATGFAFTQADGDGGLDVCFSDLYGNITKLANAKKYPVKLFAP